MDDPQNLDALVKLANDRQDDVLAQLDAAYACDKEGDEEQAVRYYEKADILKVPDEELPKFLVCYGSTLRNLGRERQAVSKLEQATDQYPDRSEAWLFLALALNVSGKKDAAFRALLRATLLEAGDTGLGGFTRAVSEYLEEMEHSDTAEINENDPL